MKDLLESDPAAFGHANTKSLGLFAQTLDCILPNDRLLYAVVMKNVKDAASLMGRRSAKARIKKWGKREFVAKMREWGKLGGRPKGTGKKEKR